LLRIANKKYTENEYEMNLTEESKVELCTNEELTKAFPPSKITGGHTMYRAISELDLLIEGSFVDIMGVVQQCNLLEKLTLKGVQVSRLKFTVADKSKYSIDVVLWGELADSFKDSMLSVFERKVVSIKSAKLCSFRGKFLSSARTTKVDCNPPTKEADELRNCQIPEHILHSLSKLPKNLKKIKSQIKVFNKARFTSLEYFRDTYDDIKQPIAFWTKGFVISITQSDNIYYSSCPTCFKKVTEIGLGTYNCVKCNTVLSRIEKRYIISLRISDYTNSQWATCFNNVAERILGISADELEKQTAGNKEKRMQYFEKAQFKQYMFKLRFFKSNNNSSDDKKIWCHINDIYSVDFPQESSRLIGAIQTKTFF